MPIPFLVVSHGCSLMPGFFLEINPGISHSQTPGKHLINPGNWSKNPGIKAGGVQARLAYLGSAIAFACQTLGKCCSSSNQALSTDSLLPLFFVSHMATWKGQYQAWAPDLPDIPRTIRASLSFLL